jgi:two-component system, OmpR family, sensor kinase
VNLLTYLASISRRLLLRAVFLGLLFTTIGFALFLISEEKRRNDLAYERGLLSKLAELTAKLRHPAGQLALLNPSLRDPAQTPLRPLLLPFASLDVDEASKARQAIETAGCTVQYPDGSALCAAVGNQFGYLYLVGSFWSTAFAPFNLAETEISKLLHARIKLKRGQQTEAWLAPLEQASAEREAQRYRLLGYVDTGQTHLTAEANEAPDVRAWLWQDKRCLRNSAAVDNCQQQSFYALRLPFKGSAKELPLTQV